MHSSFKKLTTFLLLAIAAAVFSFPALAAEEGFVNSGPGAVEASESENEPELPEGESAGLFTITGYCGCSRCSGGHLLTYSGTVPTANHTISADLDVFPLGTKLRIGDVVYTVEDKGSSVRDNLLDIYYDTHEAALANGTYSAEVFVVE